MNETEVGPTAGQDEVGTSKSHAHHLTCGGEVSREC